MRKRVLAAITLACLACLLLGCGPDEASTGDPASDSRLVIRELTYEPIDPPPQELDRVNQRLADLVDFHDRDFSGCWYDETAGQLVIGVATDRGHRILDKQGLTEGADLRVEEAERSLLEGHHLLETYLKRSVLGDRLVQLGTLPQGDGFDLWVMGDELSDAEKADLLTLPGRIYVSTGASGGTLD